MIAAAIERDRRPEAAQAALDKALDRLSLRYAEQCADAPARETGEQRGRRVLVHASGFRQSPYADVRAAGTDPRSTPGSKLWHSSPGSSGW